MRRNKEAGQALFMAAASLVVLIGVLGLGIDVGMLRYDKRIQQTAADAAAVAGANNLAWEGSGTVVCAGQNASTANAFTDTSGGGGCANGALSTCTASSASVGTVCVEVNNPPTTGPHAGTTGAANYVEAYVSVVQPTYFMRIFGVTKQTVTARAVATDVSGGTNAINCFYTLGDPANEIGVDASGSMILNATNCGIVDNGNFDPTGNKLKINTCSFGVSGQPASGPGSDNVSCNGATLLPAYNSPTAQDPFATTVTPPSNPGPSASCPAKGACNVSTSGTTTLQPGEYSSISIGSKSAVTFSAGIYYIDGAGGLGCTGSPTITGTAGVMFYFTNGATINCQGSANIDMTAMTKDQATTAGYPGDAGILMYEDPNDTNTGIPTKGAKPPCPPAGSGSNTGPQMGGNDGSIYNGVLYFPADQLYLTGNTATTAGISIGASVTYSACLGGNSTFNVIGATGLPATLPTLSTAILVE